MFTVVITEKGGEQRRLDFDKPEVTIGRVQGNDIILPKGNVSKRHSRIVLKDGKFIIVDLKSTNGTYVNGRKITSPLVIKNTDKIYIGDFILNVEDGGAAAAASAPAVSSPSQVSSLADQGQRRPPPPLPPKRKQRPSSELEPEVDLPPPQPASPPAPQERTAPPVRSTPAQPTPARPQMAAVPPVARRGSARDTLGPEIEPSGNVSGGGERSDIMAGIPQVQAQVPSPEDLSASYQTPAFVSTTQPPAGFQPAPALPSASPALPVTSPPPAAPRRTPESPAKPTAPRPAAEPADARHQKTLEIQQDVHDRLIEYLDLRRMEIERLGDDELWEKAENAICDIVEAMDGEGAIPPFVDQDLLIKNVLHEALGLGPLEDLLASEAVTEIMVNGTDQIYVERNGALELTDACFSSDKAVLTVIARIVAPTGRRIDEASPLVDVRLKDGSRVNAIIPPLALKGPTLTILKFRTTSFTPDQLIQMGTASRAMIEFMQTCVAACKNIVVGGSAGAGKTATLNVVSNFISEGERIITIEDAAELHLRHQHWVQLESRPPDLDGKGGIPIRELVRNSLRMRPDRIIVGECRGGEAFDLMQAMSTGCDGSLTTVTSHSPRETLARLETMLLMAGVDFPELVAREQIAAAINIVIHQARFSDGVRRITHISEVAGIESGAINLQDIFVFKQDGFDEDGHVRGRFVPTGTVPRMYEELQRRGIAVNTNVFRE